MATPPYITVEKRATTLATFEHASIELVVKCLGDADWREPVDVMLVLDGSTSMAGDPLIDMKAAAIAFINLLDADQDKVGLTSFATTATLRSALTTDFASVKIAINALTADGVTNMCAGIHTGQDELVANGREDVAPVMILLSDGVANKTCAGVSCATPSTSPNACTNAAVSEATATKAAGTSIYTIGLNLDTVESDFAGAGVFAETILESIATAPNYYYESPSTEDLEDVLAQIADALAGNPTNVVVTDILDTGVTFVGPGVPVPDDITGQTLTWNIGTMEVGDVETFTFEVSFDSAVVPRLVEEWPESVVEYVDYEESDQTVIIPQCYVTEGWPAVAAPVISPDGGNFTDSVEVTLTCATAGAAIRYTLNTAEDEADELETLLETHTAEEAAAEMDANHAPTAASTLYAVPFDLAEPLVLRVKAFKANYTDSPMVSATFAVSPSYQSSAGSYELEGITSLLRFAPLFVKNAGVIARSLELDSLAAPQSPPPSQIGLRVGVSAQVADPNTDDCRLVWHQHSLKNLTCLSPDTAAQHRAKNTQPSATLRWSFLRRGKILYMELRIDGLYGDAEFSRVTSELERYEIVHY